MHLTDNLFVGKLVRLSAPRPTDHEIMAKWTNNAEFMRLIDDEPALPRNPEYWADADKGDKDRTDKFSFRIRTLTDDKLLGFVELGVAWSHHGAWMGVGIGEPEYLGRGYGTDAMTLCVNYAFRELGLYKISLGVFANNARAIRSYEKVGFSREGVARAMLYRDGQRYDMTYMGILRSEWEAHHEPNR
jgi:RimJ/RimL family protein N-acetyltransferase